MFTAPGSNLQNSTGDEAEPVPPLPKDGTRGRMWSEVWKLWSWPQFPALLLRKTAAAHEAAIQEVSTRSTPTVNAAIVISKPQAVINAPARSRSHHQQSTINPTSAHHPRHSTNSATLEPYEGKHSSN
ncbi:hypothetical protein RB195_015622 [Necator americanus]|uniref:Uncharacterized protein n=1 Tax=Necator americanus TaxID=51031 RepID=A0ABR1E5E2_NECAM